MDFEPMDIDHDDVVHSATDIAAALLRRVPFNIAITDDALEESARVGVRVARSILAETRRTFAGKQSQP